MNNDALVAALGLDAVAAVHGYRLAVLVEADSRGLRVVSQALSEVVPVSPGVCVVTDPIDIRLNIVGPVGTELAGGTLAWNPAQGWSLSRPDAAPRFYAAAAAAPLDLVPTPAQVLDWATAGAVGGDPPVGLELDDDPDAVRRLLAFVNPQRAVPLFEAFLPGERADLLPRWPHVTEG
jgi:hypothetical protein